MVETLSVSQKCTNFKSVCNCYPNYLFSYKEVLAFNRHLNSTSVKSGEKYTRGMICKVLNGIIGWKLGRDQVPHQKSVFFL